jgi:hypothetical protein
MLVQVESNIVTNLQAGGQVLLQHARAVSAVVATRNYSTLCSTFNLSFNARPDRLIRKSKDRSTAIVNFNEACHAEIRL